MSPQSDIGKTPVTSLDLLRELQGEQKAFRFLIRALAVLLVTAAVIASVVRRFAISVPVGFTPEPISRLTIRPRTGMPLLFAPIS